MSRNGFVRVAGLLAGLLAACADEAPADLCELAAEHRAECLGDYVTPPICDEEAEAKAAAILEMSCDELRQLQDQGKADGAFCDWFGYGCTTDEPIFEGPRCDVASDCAAGAACLEGRCFAGHDSAEFAAMMDRWTESVDAPGNASHLLVDNAETRQLRLALIDGAERTIHLSALLLQDDATGWETVDHLLAAAARGVEVRVVVDATTQYAFSSYEVLERLARGGVEVLPSNPLTEWALLRPRIGVNANQRFHEKILTVDGSHAIVGGRNVGDDYLLADRWRDTCVYVAGPGAVEIERTFLEIWDRHATWERLAGCPQAEDYGFACPSGSLADQATYYPALDDLGPATTRIIHHDPKVQPAPLGYRAMLNLVRTARHEITIANSYFVPPRRLRKHLKAAAARGVRVRVLTNSLESTDAWWMYYASLNYYKELIGAGIEVYQYRGTETMHAKTMLVDGTLAVVGSYNLDPRSAESNSETLVVVRGGPVLEELRQAMVADLAFADRASPNISAADWAKAKAFRIVEPLL